MVYRIRIAGKGTSGESKEAIGYELKDEPKTVDETKFILIKI